MQQRRCRAAQTCINGKPRARIGQRAAADPQQIGQSLHLGAQHLIAVGILQCIVTHARLRCNAHAAQFLRSCVQAHLSCIQPVRSAVAVLVAARFVC